MTLLVTWLWQGMAIALATAAILRARPRLGAATRHAIWWLALVAVGVLPVAYAADGAWRAAAVSVLSPAAESAVPLPAVPDWFTLVLAGAWVAVALAGYARIIFSLRAVSCLKRDSTPLDVARAARLATWSDPGWAGRRPALRVSSAVHGACALGLGQPVIMLSPALLQFEDHRLDAIVMHELAHIARRDDWMQLLEAFVTATCAFHPAVRFIGRRINIEREAACDDAVVARGAEVREYARSLAEIAQAAARQPWAALGMPGAARSTSVLRHRVRRLLDPLVARDSRAGAPARLACAATMLIAVGVSVRTPVLVEFVDTAVEAPPAARLARMLMPSAPMWPVLFESSAPAPGTTPAPPQSPETRPPAPMPAGQGGNAPRQADPANGASELPPLAAIPSSSSMHFVVTQMTPLSNAGPAGQESAPPANISGPWTFFGRSAANVGQAAGRAGAATGRFFGRAGKAVAGGF